MENRIKPDEDIKIGEWQSSLWPKQGDIQLGWDTPNEANDVKPLIYSNIALMEEMGVGIIGLTVFTSRKGKQELITIG